MSSAEADVRGLAERMVTVVRGADFETLAVQLASVVGARAPRRHLFEPLLAELVAIVVRGLEARTGTPRCAGMFTVELRNADDEPVGIDEIDPALRAALRAVLAELNDDPDNARFQTELVAADPDPTARLDAVWHALLWASVLGDDPDDGDADDGDADDEEYV